MKIDTLKELEALIKLCHKQGIESIKIDNMEFKLGEQPSRRVEPRQSSRQIDTTGISPGGITDNTKIITDELTPEQLLFYSSENRDSTPDFEGMT